ncbi:MAG TPA: sugar transferase [Armatimonadota bacterium]|nr:sugar transferase [Armatimonadota bacterium]
MRSYVCCKRIIDIAIATILLVAISPLLLITGFLLWVVQGRPILFRQQRIGLNGIPFPILKFRTMVDGTPPRYRHLPVAKQPDDTRITPLGLFLRRTAIDELPQLYNVLHGEMSLVGPRPLPQDDLAEPGWLQDNRPDEYARRIEWLRKRHSVQPGLTGTWQISTKPAEDFDNWITCDLLYVNHHSLWIDLLIALQTPIAILRGRSTAKSVIVPSPRQRQSDPDRV